MVRYQYAPLAILIMFILLTVFILIADSAAQADVIWGQGAVYEGSAPVDDVPDIDSAANQTPFRFQSTRNAVGRRAAVEHFWSDDVALLPDDNGLHRVGSARVYLQDAAPTSLADSHTDAAGLTDYNNLGEAAATDFNDAASKSGGAVIEDDVGHGRLWVDSDDNHSLWVYKGVIGDDTPDPIANGWTAVQVNDGYGINPQGYNLLYNGSWQAQLVASGTDAPTGWTSTGTPPTSIAFVATRAISPSEGSGMDMAVTAAAGGPTAIEQTVADLKAGTTYTLIARVKAPAGDSCTLSTSGAGTTDASVSTTSTSYVTISDDVVTAAAIDAIQVVLANDTENDVCTWSHVALYEQNTDPVPQPGIVVVVDSNSTYTVGHFTPAGTYADSGLLVTVTPPGPGYIVSVRGKLCFQAPSNTQDRFAVSLKQNTVEVDVNGLQTSDSFSESGCLVVMSVNTSPSPGVALAYTIEATGQAMVWGLNSDQTFETPLQSYLEVTMFPVR